MMRPVIKAEIFVAGAKYAFRSFHSCPRIGEWLGLNSKDGTFVAEVYRVVHLVPSKDDERLGYQPVDIYVRRIDPKEKGGAA